MKLSSYSSHVKVVAVSGVLVSCLAGCGGGAESVSEQVAKDRLEQAKSTYAQAKVNPIVEANAMKQLLTAEQAVKEAELANKKVSEPNPMNPGGYSKAEIDTMTDDVARLAYIANRKSQGAVAYAEGVVSRNEKLVLGKDFAEAQLLKSTLEKKALQKNIDEKTTALERSRQELNAATSEAERAKILADINAKEALLAKAQADAKAKEAAQSKADLEQLMKEISELQGQMTDRGIVLTIGDVLFATGKSQLNESAQISMDKIAEFMNKNQKRNLLVEGHTDSVGSDELNRTLSEQRAVSVKSALEKLGIASERIVTVGYGKKFPIAGNDTAVGKQKNRRVEVVILNEGVKPESQFRK
jgi:outer membrane protein OmpA-like peptidoglycan-associated protein